MSRVFYYLSVSDLMLIEGFKEAHEAGDVDFIKAALWKWGLDITKKWEIEMNSHRNLQKQIYTGERYTGVERIDQEWRSTGFMSTEALIASSKFGLASELRGMSREGFSGRWDEWKDAAIDFDERKDD